ncbi:fagellar hook-basal body protein [Solidesulfovibrio fructosivorans JJ]]|uniref:Flagellar hook protein FlgE n=1 Tax=Solidesulfovibrio fructosivorans JJ] TaxID=596151 RepID=E1K0M0_SOLFR|nr:flagellar hook protein FlgE [Solidesulfovibrio fructosivorans]EFL49872.1 fagellar hook-basal body protein [Solidesulfovibrio fructosivorans JJ]]
MGVGLNTAMWSGVSGLMANSTKMTSIGNNLANVNTYGFKSARTDFVTLMSATIGTASGVDQVGRGVRVGSVVTDYSQGGLEITGTNTDMAINGNGFFMVKQKSSVGSNGKMLNTGNQTMYYTRAGDFHFDENGYLSSTTGLAVQGWKVDQDKIDTATASGTTLSSTPITGQIRDIVLDSYSSPAKATTSTTVITNLDSDSVSATTRNLASGGSFYAMSASWDGTKDPAMASTAYDYQTTVKVYDANGSPHTLTVYYDKIKNDNGKEYWEYSVTCDPAEDGRVDLLSNALAGTQMAGLLMVGTMTFDSSGSMENMSAYTLKASNATAGAFNSNLWSVANISSSGYPEFTANFKSVSNGSFTDQGNATSISLNLGMRCTTGWATGTTLGDIDPTDMTTLGSFNPAQLKINSNVTTNYATSSSTVFTSQNGYTAGLLTSVSVDSDGVLTGTFSNGVSLQLWVLALANFTNLQGLNNAGNSLYTATLESGEGTTNRPNSGSVGSISGNTLESSNVDMAAEMVSMIVTQRGFEGNSKTITTVDTMLSEIIQLKR